MSIARRLPVPPLRHQSARRVVASAARSCVETLEGRRLLSTVLTPVADTYTRDHSYALTNFGAASFVSSGDIRLSSTARDVSEMQLAAGALYTPGNLTFQAADLYPASGEIFVIDAVGPQPTTITFLGNGSSPVPLSVVT